MKKDLTKKLEVNPNAQKILRRNEGQTNMTLNLTPQTLKMLSDTHMLDGEESESPSINAFTTDGTSMLDASK